MNDKSLPSRPTCVTPATDLDAVCDECGVFGAYALGDRHLCLDCYVVKGSCCPEFGKDDLWRSDDLEKSSH